MLSVVPPTAAPGNAGPTAYWRQTLRLSRLLLGLWFLLTLAVCLFGRRLHFNFFGWPFGFWVSAQGALIVYCLIVWYYAWAMNRLDQAEAEHEDD